MTNIQRSASEKGSASEKVEAASKTRKNLRPLGLNGRISGTTAFASHNSGKDIAPAGDPLDIQ
jgi:hypothetical protein